MKITEQKTIYFFVDESGDPDFYGKGGNIIVGSEGCSRVLLIGFVRIGNPEPLRGNLSKLREQIANDKYLKNIPSIKKTLRNFHAKDDCPEVRMMVYKALSQCDFAAQVIVARKIERMFRTRYQGNKDRFYDDLVSRLFENQLHRAETNKIVFSRRGNKMQQHRMREAIKWGIQRFQKKWGIDVRTELHVETRLSSEDFVLQAADYANWAVQRAFERGEMRYFDFLREKYELIYDVFDTANYKCGGNFYDRLKNPFHLDKATPLG
jgi:hypothetical protein